MPRRDHCVLFEPKARTDPARSQLDGVYPGLPPATREHTHRFREFRKEFEENRVAMDGPRVGQLRQILKDNDAQGLQKFLEAKRGGTAQLEPGQTCKWCNKRIVEVYAQSRPPAWGRKLPPSVEGPSAPRLCQICWEWHCVEHCSRVSRIASGRNILEITCCRQCNVFLDVERWHREGRQEAPRLGLPDSAEQLLAAHTAFEEAAFAADRQLAQLEGLSRTVEVGSPSTLAHLEDPSLQLQRSRAAAEQARKDIEAAVRSVKAVVPPAERERDATLQRALMRKGKELLESLNPRLQKALARTEEVCAAAQVKTAARASPAPAPPPPPMGSFREGARADVGAAGTAPPPPPMGSFREGARADVRAAGTAEGSGGVPRGTWTAARPPAGTWTVP